MDRASWKFSGRDRYAAATCGCASFDRFRDHRCVPRLAIADGAVLHDVEDAIGKLDVRIRAVQR
jgi:hypothetical protein